MNRDDLIAEDYTTGRTVPEISRIHGVSIRRVYQILEETGVKRTRINGVRMKNTSALSRCHDTIGRRVYDHWFDLQIERQEAARQLGWTVAKLRAVEEGRRNLDLFDLRDLAIWMKTTIGDLVDGC